MAMSVNKVQGFQREHNSSLEQCCREGLTCHHLAPTNEARVDPLG